MSIRDDIANAMVEASEALAYEELGKRYKTVYYRLKAGTGGNKKLGIRPTKQDWDDASSIDPNPIFEEKDRFVQMDIGIVKQSQTKLKINKPLFTKSQLESYEYKIDDSEFTLVNGQVKEEPYYWLLYLQRKQVNE